MNVATATREKERLRLGHFSRMADVIPEGTSGNAAVDHFEITPDTWQGFGHERISNGRYARLKIQGATVMSDTDMELRTNIGAVLDARGDVLIGGLGLGCIALPILRKPGVRSVTIVERNADVIRLVEDPLRRAITGLQSAGLVIWHADVRTWRPIPQNVCKFDYIYFDIWTDACTDDIEDRKQLHLAFRRYLRKGGKVTSWEYERLRYLRRAGRWR